MVIIAQDKMKWQRSPLKIQGSKFKLLDQIEQARAKLSKQHRVWIEPFMGSATVGLNLAKTPAYFYDINPFTVHFFNDLINGSMTIDNIQKSLITAQKAVAVQGGDFYYNLRDRFNTTHSPLDFFILNHLSHSGLVRFNRQGAFNTPYGKSKALPCSLITSLIQRCNHIRDAGRHYGWVFKENDFRTGIESHADDKDALVFLDPPYIERNSTYFSPWSMTDEHDLFNAVKNIKGSFLLTTWISDDKISNPAISSYWSQFPYISRMHRYFVRGQAKNVIIKEAVFYRPHT